MAAERFEVSLHGGSPWGFRLQGGKEFRAPLLIAKVTPGSKAAKEGILFGDWLIRINNEPCDDMNHSNALNCIKRTGNDLVLELERRPYDDTGSFPHSTNSLPRGTKLTNGVPSNNNEFKSIAGYATLPRSRGNRDHKDGDRQNYENDFDAEGKEEDTRSNSLATQSSGISSTHTEDDKELFSRGYGTISPSNDEWSPDLISDAVRTPQPIRLVSSDEPSPPHHSNTETIRVKSPTSVHGFTDKPSPVGRGARRNNDEEIKDFKDYPLLNSGSTANDEDHVDDDSGKRSKSPPLSPVSPGRSRPAISHMVKRREGVPMPLHDTSADPSWTRYHYVDDERRKRAAEQPYRRYSYHGSVLKDDEPKSADATERPRIQAGSGWYKELFKEMHTGAGNSTGLSSLLAGDASPPKNDARGLFKGYRRTQPTQDSTIRATKTQNTQAEPSSSSQTSRFSRPAPQHDADKTYRHSHSSSLPSSMETTPLAEVQMREKPTTRSNVPSWYRELQKGKEVSEEEIIEDRRTINKGYQVPGGVRSPGDVGPEYPVVRSFSLGTRPASGPVVHHEPPQKHNTQTYQQRDNTTKPAMRYSAATHNTSPPRNTAASLEEKERDKPSASNLYEDHMRNRQLSPRPERKYDRPMPADYIKQFEEEEERFKEDERRAKEDLERKLREGNRAKEEAERKRREIELKKKEEMESRKNPKRARALYNFVPQSPKEIAFRKGDVITFYRTIDANWCEGEAQGKIGLFPSSYVEILEEHVLKTEGEGRVKYNFKAESPRELNLQKGDIVEIIRQIDKNWFEGVSDDRIGIFPVSYIEVIREPAAQPQQVSPKRVQEQITKQNGLPEVHSAPGGFNQQRDYEEQQVFDDGLVNSDAKDGDINNLEGERFTVVFGYAPQNEDELELLEGDLVKVVEKCDDGWFVGISERTGDFGTFPGNYVKKVA